MKPNQNSSRGEESIRQNVALVNAISDGCVKSWQEFILQYSRLIFGVVKRHLPAENEDDVRAISVELLKQLYGGDLAKYRGRTLLSTWLFVYAKRRSLDYWRAKRGRFREPVGLKRLKDIDREVLRLFYIDKLGIEIVLQSLNWNGNKTTAEQVVESIQRIEDTLDRRYLRRLQNEYQARMNQASSIQLMKYMCQLRVEYESRLAGNTPDSLLMEQETYELAERVRALVAKLPETERRIIELRFDRQKTVKEISNEMNLGGPRKVYTIIERVVKRLRESIQKTGMTDRIAEDLRGSHETPPDR